MEVLSFVLRWYPSSTMSIEGFGSGNFARLGKRWTCRILYRVIFCWILFFNFFFQDRVARDASPLFPLLFLPVQFPHPLSTCDTQERFPVELWPPDDCVLSPFAFGWNWGIIWNRKCRASPNTLPVMSWPPHRTLSLVITKHFSSVNYNLYINYTSPFNSLPKLLHQLVCFYRQNNVYQRDKPPGWSQEWTFVRLIF